MPIEQPGIGEIDPFSILELLLQSMGFLVLILLVLFGLAFLLETLNVLTSDAVSVIWPILVIVAGGSKLGEGRCKCC